jgi:hypothetical protein
MVQTNIKTSGLLMEAGVSYNKQRLHKAGYFRELLATNPDIDEGLRSLLPLCRETKVRLGKTESAPSETITAPQCVLFAAALLPGKRWCRPTRLCIVCAVLQ